MQRDEPTPDAPERMPTPRTDAVLASEPLHGQYGGLRDLARQLERELAALSPEAGAGLVRAGWRYRNKKTGVVTLTEQPPDRVLFRLSLSSRLLWPQRQFKPAPQRGSPKGKK